MGVESINNSDGLKDIFENIQENINKLSISDVQKLAFSNALQTLSTISTVVSTDIKAEKVDDKLSITYNKQKFGNQISLIRQLRSKSEKFSQNTENQEATKDFINQLNLLVKTVFEVESYLSNSDAQKIINSL